MSITLLEPRKSTRINIIRNAFWFRDHNCIKATCFSPRMVKPISKNFIRKIHKGDFRHAPSGICWTFYSNGYQCPEHVEYDDELGKQRISDGWTSRPL